MSSLDFVQCPRLSTADANDAARLRPIIILRLFLFNHRLSFSSPLHASSNMLSRLRRCSFGLQVIHDQAYFKRRRAQIPTYLKQLLAYIVTPVHVLKFLRRGWSSSHVTSALEIKLVNWVAIEFQVHHSTLGLLSSRQRAIPFDAIDHEKLQISCAYSLTHSHAF